MRRKGGNTAVTEFRASPDGTEIPGMVVAVEDFVHGGESTLIKPKRRTRRQSRALRENQGQNDTIKPGRSLRDPAGESQGRRIKIRKTVVQMDTGGQRESSSDPVVRNGWAASPDLGGPAPDGPDGPGSRGSDALDEVIRANAARLSSSPDPALDTTYTVGSDGGAVATDEATQLAALRSQLAAREAELVEVRMQLNRRSKQEVADRRPKLAEAEAALAGVGGAADEAPPAPPDEELRSRPPGELRPAETRGRSTAAPAVPPGEYGLKAGEQIVEWTESDPDIFVRTAIPKDKMMLTNLHRIVKKGKLPGKKETSFKLYHESPSGERTALLVASRERRGKNMCYVITNNRSYERLAKVKSNLAGTEFHMYGARTFQAPGLPKFRHIAEEGQPCRVEKVETTINCKGRSELGRVEYCRKGKNGPRQMVVELPGQDGEPAHFMINVLPKYNKATGTFTMNFFGRCTESSIKNFQLREDRISEAEHKNDFVVNFGKTGKDTFNLDFRGPLTPTQAFGIVLTSFESSLGESRFGFN